MKNSKVKVATLANHTAEMQETDTDQAKVMKLQRAEMRNSKFSKISDAVAGSDHWFRNEPIPHGLDLFPEEWFMRYSDLFYPVAKGGPLYIDTPGSPTEINYCEKKLEAYRKLNVRYTYIKAHDEPWDAEMRLHFELPVGMENKA